MDAVCNNCYFYRFGASYLEKLAVEDEILCEKKNGKHFGHEIIEHFENSNHV